jgi:hypothetical protein
MIHDDALLGRLDEAFSSTRESLRTVACYVLAPACRARTGHIWLVPTPYGFGTPPLGDGARLIVRGDRLFDADGASIALTTIRAAATFARVELGADPGIGHDLPPYAPDTPLRVDAAASVALGTWYAFGKSVFESLFRADPQTRAIPRLWPEHFDLAVTFYLNGRVAVNVGFSPGDALDDEPYVYVAPHDLTHLNGVFWNAPFGATLRYRDIQTRDPENAALKFIQAGLHRAAGR